MTQMADEIRALIADLYDDPDSFLKTPHQWFGGRSPDELMATEAGQFMLLRFLRGRDHVPPIEPDRDFHPDTTESADQAIDQAITRLEGQIEQLKSLKGSGPEIATVIGRAREVYGDEGLLWLLEYNQVLQTTPLELVLQGKAERVLTQLGWIRQMVDSILKCKFRYKQRVRTRRPNDPAGGFGSTPQLTQFSILEANQRRTSRRKVPKRLRGSRTS